MAYYVAASAVVLYVFSYFIPVLFDVASLLLILLGVSILVDGFLVFGKRYALRAERITAERWSNGDENKVTLHFQNNYSFPITADIIDELPVHFQDRNWHCKGKLDETSEGHLTYTLTPVTRSEYVYGKSEGRVKGRLQVVTRRV